MQTPGQAQRRLRIKPYKRRAYTRSDGKRVKATTVRGHFRPDRGAPGRTPVSRRVLPKLKPDEWPGYRLAKPQADRRRALRQASRRYGTLATLRRAVVLRTYNKRNPALFRKLDADVKYLQQLHSKKPIVKPSISKSKRTGKSKNSNKNKK